MLCGWLSFIREIAVPTNARAAEILTERSHLFDGMYPPCVLQLLAHQVW